ncbi:MAG TPA: aldo/keto reductase, partial [Egibacteraceae bacterium]|nr:aldo/keto reductase [Egibacteraceae bacterium]
SLEERRGQIESYEALCDKISEHPADVALAWLLAQPAVTAPIIGPRTLEQFNGSLRALEIELDDAALDDLDAIFPRIGPAPEAFAW